MDQKAYLDQAAEHFRALLTEQLNRQARMSQGSPAKDFSRMERIVIGPTIAFIGFVAMGVSIIIKPDSKKENSKKESKTSSEEK